MGAMSTGADVAARERNLRVRYATVARTRRRPQRLCALQDRQPLQPLRLALPVATRPGPARLDSRAAAEVRNATVVPAKL